MISKPPTSWLWIQEQRRQFRCRWKDFAVLYRSHFHRDEIAKELGEKEIPFSIENMDVLDTPEVRDVLACLGAVDSTADAASLLRVAALPRFQIDPEKFRAAMRALPRDPQGQSTPLAVLLGQIEGGPAVLETLRKVREAMNSTGSEVSRDPRPAGHDVRLRSHFSSAAGATDVRR